MLNVFCLYCSKPRKFHNWGGRAKLKHYNSRVQKLQTNLSRILHPASQFWVFSQEHKMTLRGNKGLYMKAIFLSLQKYNFISPSQCLSCFTWPIPYTFNNNKKLILLHKCEHVHIFQIWMCRLHMIPGKKPVNMTHCPTNAANVPLSTRIGPRLPQQRVQCSNMSVHCPTIIFLFVYHILMQGFFVVHL